MSAAYSTLIRPGPLTKVCRRVPCESTISLAVCGWPSSVKLSVSDAKSDPWAAATDRPQHATYVRESVVPPERPKPKPAAGAVERISVRTVGRRVRIVGDTAVATLSADGPHVLRRNGAKAAGFNLKYESASGFKSTGAWHAVPGDDKWYEKTWTISDDQFVGKWGYNFSFDSDSTANSAYSIQSVTIKKL